MCGSEFSDSHRFKNFDLNNCRSSSSNRKKTSLFCLIASIHFDATWMVWVCVSLFDFNFGNYTTCQMGWDEMPNDGWTFDIKHRWNCLNRHSFNNKQLNTKSSTLIDCVFTSHPFLFCYSSIHVLHRDNGTGHTLLSIFSSNIWMEIGCNVMGPVGPFSGGKQCRR